MTREVRKALDAHRKFVILEHAKGIGKVTETCHEFGVARSSFYRWRQAYKRERKEVLLLLLPWNLILTSPRARLRAA